MPRRLKPHGYGPISGYCTKCGTWRLWLQQDHVLPKSLGGTDDPSNIQLLCANCHEDKTQEDYKRPEWIARQRENGRKGGLTRKGAKYPNRRKPNAAATQ